MTTFECIVGAFKRNMETFKCKVAALLTEIVVTALFNSFIFLVYGFILSLLWRWFAAPVIRELLKVTDVTIGILPATGLVVAITWLWRVRSPEEQITEGGVVGGGVLRQKACLVLRRALVWLSCGGAVKLLMYLFAS